MGCLFRYVIAVVAAVLSAMLWAEVISRPLLCREDPGGCIAVDALAVGVVALVLGVRRAAKGCAREEQRSDR